MADQKISQLTGATTPLAGTEELPLVQSGVTKKVSVDNLTAGKAVSASSMTATNLKTSPTTANLDISGTTIAAAGSDANVNVTITPKGTGQVVVPVGSATNPSVAASGDLNTGINFPAADTIALATGGFNRFYMNPFGCVGLDAIPSAWSGALGLGVLQNRSYFSIAPYDSLPLNFLVNNAYFDGANWKYLTSNAALLQTFVHTGEFVFSTAPSGTAGNNVTFTDRVIINNDGYMLIGYASSNGAYKLQVNSQIFATNATIATSDGQYKENIVSLDGALNDVCALNPVQFSWKKHPVHNFDYAQPNIGFIAQEVQQVLADKPYLNSIIKANKCVIEPAKYETIEIEPAIEEVKDEDGNVIVQGKSAVTKQKLVKEAVTEEFLGIAESNMVPLLTKAIQELKEELDSLKDEIRTLKGS